MCNARSTTPLFIKNDQSSTSSSSRSEPVQISTPSCAPEPIEVDISTLSAEDLQSLKREDPFLYYSIPAVRRAALFNLEEPDMSESSLEDSTTVKRCTRVSFECHTDLLMEDLLGDIEDEEYDQSDFDQMDLAFSRLLGLASSASQQ